MLINKHKILEKHGSIKSVRTVSEAYIRYRIITIYLYLHNTYKCWLRLRLT